ncbi:MAG: hypothetical protein ACODAU_07870 [Myxococcota bacterium]
MPPSLRLLFSLIPALGLGCGGGSAGDGGMDGGMGMLDGGALDERCVLDRTRDEPPLTTDDVRVCARCVDSHARLANPLRVTGSIAVTATAVPRGLLITDYSFGPVVTFLTDEGEHVMLDELALDDAPFENLIEGLWVEELRQEVHAIHGIEWSPGLYGWDAGTTWAAPVPGTNRVWIGTRFRAYTDQFLNREDFVLYEYGPEGWERLAAGHTIGRASYQRTALDGGELVAEMLDDRWLRIRANPDGSVDMRFREPEAELDLPSNPRTRWIYMSDLWPLPSGDVAIMVGERLTLDDGVPAWRTWLGVLDADLDLVVPWQLFGAEVDDPAYAPGQAPFARADWRSVVLPDRRAFTLAFGTLAETDAVGWQHRWGMWVTEEGNIEPEPPGILLNPDRYLEGDGTRDPTGASHGLPGGRVGIVWDDGNFGGEPGHTWGQVVEPDGGTLFEEPKILGPSINERAIWTWWAQDGAGHAYLAAPRFDGVSVPELRTGIQRVGIDLEYEWEEPTIVHTCPELLSGEGNGPFVIEGAHDEGVWVLWADVVPTVTGRGIQVYKVTLLRPDGSFAWE